MSWNPVLNKFIEIKNAAINIGLDSEMAYKRKEIENMEGLLKDGKKKFVKYEERAAMFSMGVHSFHKII